MNFKRKVYKRIIEYLEKKIGRDNYSILDVEKILLYIINNELNADHYYTSFNAEYYQLVHESNDAFSNNNWLMEDFDFIESQNAKIISELACGNGEFTKAISRVCDHVYALDWAASPELGNLPHNVTFMQVDIARSDIPKTDLVCSGDFLEHLPTNLLPEIIEKIINSAPKGYHKVACYDDGHSHLSVLSPWHWLDLFKRIDGSYFVDKVEFRDGRFDKLVIVLTNTGT